MDPAKLAQEFTQPHFNTPPAKKSWRAEVRLQGKLQANRGCVTLQRRGCRSNSGLEILRRTRSFPERTSSAGSVAAIFWQLETFVYGERHVDEIAPSSSFTVYECCPLQPSGGCASTGKPVMSCTPNKIFLEAKEVSAAFLKANAATELLVDLALPLPLQWLKPS